MERPLSGPACARCGAGLTADLRCALCGVRFALVEREDPSDRISWLQAELGATRDGERRGALRTELSRRLAQDRRSAELRGLWAGIPGAEADLWRGAVAVIDQPETSEDAVAPLERAAAALAAAGRHDLLALARTYLVIAYQSVRRLDDAEATGDAALAAALQERDAAACVRAAISRYWMSFDLRGDYRGSITGLARVADAMRPWDADAAATLDASRARMMLVGIDRASAFRLVAALPDAMTPTLQRQRALMRLRWNALVAMQERDNAGLEAALRDIARAGTNDSSSEVPRWIALRRAEAANIAGDSAAALAFAHEAMPPAWHLACPLRVEARLAISEALARALPTSDVARRRRAAVRAVRRADMYERSDIAWREMRWRLIAGQLLRSVRERREAMRQLQRGEELADALGINSAREEFRALLRALGLTAARRGRRDANVPQLTTREAEIARMAARGATNGDIARALVLSEATIARHLSNILTKLDLPNRRAIAAAIGEGVHT